MLTRAQGNVVVTHIWVCCAVGAKLATLDAPGKPAPLAWNPKAKVLACPSTEPRREQPRRMEYGRDVSSSSSPSYPLLIYALPR